MSDPWWGFSPNIVSNIKQTKRINHVLFHLKISKTLGFLMISGRTEVT